MTRPATAQPLAPWLIPTPVVPMDYASLHRRHRAFAVETDLSAIGAFGAPAAEDLLFTDLQTNLDTNAERRLGSGRAGFYRGGYLKGIGRTQLAANFCRPGDAYHAS